MVQRWAKVADHKSDQRPEIHGLFVNGILVGTYFEYQEIYMANIYCYMSAELHRSIMVSSIEAARTTVESLYIRSHCSLINERSECCPSKTSVPGELPY